MAEVAWRISPRGCACGEVYHTDACRTSATKRSRNKECSRSFSPLLRDSGEDGFVRKGARDGRGAFVRNREGGGSGGGA